MISAPASERRAPEGLLLGMDALKEETRLRLLRLLERHELGVAPLCEILQLPQSTVSRHLKVLSDHGYVQSRAQGTNRLYRMARLDRESAARRLWLLVRGETEGWATARHDDLRLRRVLAGQEPAAQAFFAGAAGQWDRLREEAYGRSLNQTALLALLPAKWTVADLGCGTGALAASLAPHVRRVIGVDQSAAMLKAARARTAGLDNVELRKGSLEDLPIEDGLLRRRAARARAQLRHRAGAGSTEMARILRPGGRAVVIDVLRHDREDFQRTMGQAVPGFEAEALREMMGDAGCRWRPAGPWPPSRGRRARPCCWRRPSGAFARRARFHEGPSESRGQVKENAMTTTVATPAAKGALEYKVKDLSLAEWGRKEIRLAEQEMPGLMAVREEWAGQEAPRRPAHHRQPAHDHPDRGPDRDPEGAGRRSALVLLQHLLDPGPRGGGGRGRPEGHAWTSPRASPSSPGRARPSRSTGT